MALALMLARKVEKLQGGEAVSTVIHTEGLRKDYGALVAVRDVDLRVDAGQVVGLIGPNGAGKTTLIRMLGTLLLPTSGRASVLNHDIQRDYLAIRKRIGYLPDFFNLYRDLTLKECLEFFARAYGADPATARSRGAVALEYVELTEKRDDLIRHLSRGMVQRLGMASLMVHEPDIFLLDEPASGLDPKARIGLRRILKRLSAEGRTVIISSHILTELAGFCTHIGIMNRGAMAVYDDVDAVHRRAGGEHRVRVSLLADLDKAVRVIEKIDACTLAAIEGKDLVVITPDDPAALANLNRRLVKAGLDVTGLTPEKLDLEDVFVQIAGGEEQDVQ